MDAHAPTQQEVLSAIQKVAAVLGPRFAFGPFTPDDIGQEVAVFCLEALPRFRPEAGQLEGFLFRHAKNRLTNYKRDRLRRCDPPCRPCWSGLEHERGPACEAFARWKARNERPASCTPWT
jgi:DNA-directed RNA polymerase specialized sigma24 family protein